jgi:hypothetical protein
LGLALFIPADMQPRPLNKCRELFLSGHAKVLAQSPAYVSKERFPSKSAGNRSSPQKQLSPLSSAEILRPSIGVREKSCARMRRCAFLCVPVCRSDLDDALAKKNGGRVPTCQPIRHIMIPKPLRCNGPARAGCGRRRDASSGLCKLFFRVFSARQHRFSRSFARDSSARLCAEKHVLEFRA